MTSAIVPGIIMPQCGQVTKYRSRLIEGKLLMVSSRKMKKQDVPMLYEIALRAFQPDYKTYEVYLPLLRTEKKCFLPPLMFGRVIVANDIVIGGIFIDPAHQKKGYGRQAIPAIEALYPKVRKWKLDTPSENYHLHQFYESMGFVKTGEIKDPKSNMVGFIYEKTI